MSLDRIIFALSALSIFVFSNNYKDKLEKFNPYTVEHVAPMQSLQTPQEREKESRNDTVAGIHKESNSTSHL